jgi:hypothetical protein
MMQENKINHKINLIVHSCWCIILIVLGLNSNLFEFKWLCLNGWSKEKGKERE